MEFMQVAGIVGFVVMFFVGFQLAASWKERRRKNRAE